MTVNGSALKKHEVDLVELSPKMNLVLPKKVGSEMVIHIKVHSVTEL